MCFIQMSRLQKSRKISKRNDLFSIENDDVFDRYDSVYMFCYKTDKMLYTILSGNTTLIFTLKYNFFSRRSDL